LCFQYSSEAFSIGEDIAVILAGYEAQMMKMIRNQNPGLARRFDVSYAFRFQNFSDDELLSILYNSALSKGIHLPFGTNLFAVSKLSQRRALPNFGNAGTAENLITDAIRKMSIRNDKERNRDPLKVDERLLPEDFEDESHQSRQSNPLKALEDLSDAGDFKRKLEDIGRQIIVRNKYGKEIKDLLSNYVFTGSPGTGKTTVASRMATVLHSYGLLATDHVELTSAQDLCGSYVGQTAPKVEAKMQAARGGVLFIDEAYELGKGVYGEEALVKLLSMLTEPDYMGNMVVILAGYHEQMHQMMELNPGLKSRFQDFVEFPNWIPSRCSEFVKKQLVNERGYKFGHDEAEQKEMFQMLEDGFETLSKRSGWANARDAIRMIKEIEKQWSLRVHEPNYLEDSEPCIAAPDVSIAVETFLRSRPEIQLRKIEQVNALQVQIADAPHLQKISTKTHHHEKEIEHSDLVEDKDAYDGEAKELAADGGDDDDDDDDDVKKAKKDVDESGMWNGIDIEKELTPLNDVIKSLKWETEEKVNELIKKGPDSLDASTLVDQLMRKGFDKRAAREIVNKWIAASEEVRKLNYQRELEGRMRNRKPIIQCQVCKRTANYWTPCPVAPMQIGWETIDVPALQTRGYQ
jgi:SpoVK/Ycf46/Vps4 family AAA+-type ATPase